MLRKPGDGGNHLITSCPLAEDIRMPLAALVSRRGLPQR